LNLLSIDNVLPQQESITYGIDNGKTIDTGMDNFGAVQEIIAPLVPLSSSNQEVIFERIL
jgi:hypothetical protein